MDSLYSPLSSYVWNSPQLKDLINQHRGEQLFL